MSIASVCQHQCPGQPVEQFARRGRITESDRADAGQPDKGLLLLFAAPARRRSAGCGPAQPDNVINLVLQETNDLGPCLMIYHGGGLAFQCQNGCNERRLRPLSRRQTGSAQSAAKRYFSDSTVKAQGAHR